MIIKMQIIIKIMANKVCAQNQSDAFDIVHVQNY